MGFLDDVLGGHGPDEGVLALVPAVDEGAELRVEVLDGLEDAAAHSLAYHGAGQNSTRFIHDAWVGVKCTTKRALEAGQVLAACLWAAYLSITRCGATGSPDSSRT